MVVGNVRARGVGKTPAAQIKTQVLCNTSSGKRALPRCISNEISVAHTSTHSTIVEQIVQQRLSEVNILGKRIVCSTLICEIPHTPKVSESKRAELARSTRRHPQTSFDAKPNGSNQGQGRARK